MIRVYLLTLTLNFGCRNGVALLNQTEERITMELMKTLDVRHWILAGDSDFHSADMNRLKIFANWNLPVTYQSTPQLYEYFLEESFPDINTLIVFKVPNLRIVIRFLNSLAEVKKETFIFKFKWLIFVDEAVSEKEQNELWIPYNCFFLLVQFKHHVGFELIEIYKVKNRTFKFNYAVWDDGLGLITTNLTFYMRRKDLNGTKLIMEYFGDKEVCVTKRQCTHLQVLDDFAQLMNFRFHWVPHPAEVDDQYFAVGGDITNQAYPYNSELYDTRTDHLAPLFKIKINWYIKRPTFAEHADYYLRPFDEELWFAILTCLIICMLACILMYCSWGSLVKLECETDRASLIDLIFTTPENFCNQDGCPKKRVLAFRVACFFLRFFALFIIPAYSGNIISHIAARKAVVPFLTLKGFVKNGKYTIGAIPDSYFDTFFKMSRDLLAQKIYKNYYIPVEKSEIAKKLCKELFAFVELDNDIYDYEFKCTTYRIKIPLGFVFTASNLPKHSPFTRVFHHNFIQYYSSGIQEKMQTMLTGERFRVVKPKSYRRATIHQMIQVFSIVPIGILLANVLLFLEIIIKWIRKRYCYHTRTNSRIVQLEKIKLFS